MRLLPLQHLLALCLILLLRCALALKVVQVIRETSILLHYKYGSSATANPARGGYENQVGDLYLPIYPVATPTPVVVLFHGGYWQEPFRRKTSNGSSMVPLALDLQKRGYAVVNLEYRRAFNYPWPSSNSGGFPASLNDVINGIDALACQELSVDNQLDLDRIVTIGHSAGGQLALWMALQAGISDSDRKAYGLARSKLHPIAAVGLAAVTDMYGACTEGTASCGAVRDFLGPTTDSELRNLAKVTSPYQMVEGFPFPIQLLLVHGVDDRIVLPEQSASFAQHASKSSRVDAKSCIFTTFDRSVPRNEHFDAINPDLDPWRDWVIPFLNDVVRTEG